MGTRHKARLQNTTTLRVADGSVLCARVGRFMRHACMPRSVDLVSGGGGLSLACESWLCLESLATYQGLAEQ